jgi:hypothetical protein
MHMQLRVVLGPWVPVDRTQCVQLGMLDCSQQRHHKQSLRYRQWPRDGFVNVRLGPNICSWQSSRNSGMFD